MFKKDHRVEAKSILKNTMRLSNNVHEENWGNIILDNFSNPSFFTRTYANEVLIQTVLEEAKKTTPSHFSAQLCNFCKRDLENRTFIKPLPPETWTRKVPESRYYQNQWNRLKDFLESPTRQILDFKAVKAERSAMEDAINNVTIDLKMETIKKGSPHTLRITKTQSAYKRKLKNWKKDVELLERLNGLELK